LGTDAGVAADDADGILDRMQKPHRNFWHVQLNQVVAELALNVIGCG